MVINEQTKNDPAMGIWGIPGTFPTGKVLDRILKSDPGEIASKWTRDKVNDIYFWYKEGVKQGHKPWSNEDRQIANFITEHTKFSIGDTNMFGWVVFTMARDGELENQYYTVDIPQTAKFPEIPFLPSRSDVLKYANIIKWVGISGIVGVVVYFSWPLLAKGRTKLKKRMA